MSKQDPIEAVCECGHTWKLQKPPEEMADGPRCSECGARGEAISVVDEEQHRTSAEDTDSEIVRAAMCERHLNNLHDGVDELLESLAGTAPEEVDAEVARGVRGPYRELRRLKEELDRKRDDDTETSLAELDAVEDRLNREYSYATRQVRSLLLV